LRVCDPPILVRVKGESVFVDLRTVSTGDEKTLLRRLRETIENIRGRE
jgi:hypothetical protein